MSKRLAAPALPTYQAVATFLEKKNGSGIKLLGWTILRTLLIAPPFKLVGVPWKQAVKGALLASGIISAFTLIRIRRAGPDHKLATALGRARRRAR